MTDTGIPLSAMEPFNVGRSAYRLFFDFGVLLKCFSDSPNKRVLDFGAGTGWISEFLARLGYEVYSIDIDKGMPGSIRFRLSADKRLNSAVIQPVIGSGMALPFPDGFFSHICCFDTLHHMTDYPQTFREMGRVLEPGGRSVFIEPGARHSRSKETIAFIETYKKDDPDWIERDVVLDEIAQISKECGFSGLTVLPMLLPGLKNYSAGQWDKFRRGDRSLTHDYLTLLKDFNYNDHLYFYCEKPAGRIKKNITTKSSAEGMSPLAGKKIAVDLTPMLPGGDNGGAKLMTLELLRALAELLPETSFLLLSAESSHADLNQLEAHHPNIQSMCVLRSSLTVETPASEIRMSGRQSLLELLKSIARRSLPQGVKQRLKSWSMGRTFTGKSTGFLRDLNVDLLFCPFTAPFYADPLIPAVSVIYDLQYRAYPQFFTPDEVAQREDSFNAACQKTDHLVAISEFVRTTVIEAGNLSPERVTAVQIGLLHTNKVSENTAAGAALLEKHGLQRGEYILYPANFWQHKNHAMLLTAYNIHRQAYPSSPLKLVCTGAPGPGADAFCEAARRMGLADRVIYAGFVTSAEYDGLLRSSFALIFPSLYEGFGIPVLEAMSAGVPVMCSDVTSLPEVGGDAVLYFDPRLPKDIAQVLASLYDDPGLRGELIARGKERALEFGSAGRMALQYAEVFSKALTPRIRKYKNSLSGVHSDGWTGAAMQVCFAPATAGVARSLHLSLNCPKWVTAPVQIQVTLEKIQVIKPLYVGRGKTTRIKIPLPDTGGALDFTLDATFNPARAGISSDNRELGLRCLQCEIVDPAGNVVLFSL